MYTMRVFINYNIVYYNVYHKYFCVFIEKNMCIPSFVVIGCCVSE